MNNGIITTKKDLTLYEIAQLIGSAQQTVTTTLNEFKFQELIDFSQEGLIINNLTKLKEISE